MLGRSVAVGLVVKVPVAVAEAVAVNVAVGVADAVGLGVAVAVGVALGRSVAVGLVVKVPRGVCVGVAVEAAGVGVGVRRSTQVVSCDKGEAAGVVVCDGDAVVPRGDAHPAVRGVLCRQGDLADA